MTSAIDFLNEVVFQLDTYDFDGPQEGAINEKIKAVRSNPARSDRLMQLVNKIKSFKPCNSLLLAKIESNKNTQRIITDKLKKIEADLSQMQQQKTELKARLLSLDRGRDYEANLNDINTEIIELLYRIREQEGKIQTFVNQLRMVKVDGENLNKASINLATEVMKLHDTISSNDNSLKNQFVKESSLESIPITFDLKIKHTSNDIITIYVSST